MRHGPRKSAEIAVKAVAMRATGMSWVVIAKRMRVKVEWLRYWTAKVGHEPGQSSDLKTSPARLAEARELRAQGMCWKLIERRMGISCRTLQYGINKENKLSKKALD